MKVMIHLINNVEISFETTRTIISIIDDMENGKTIFMNDRIYVVSSIISVRELPKE